MSPKTTLSSKFKNIARQRRFIVVSGITACILIMIAVAFWIPLPWQFAHKDAIPVVPVTLSIKDNEDLWRAEYEGSVEGAGTHWLGHKGLSVPSKRDGGLWYDGELVAKETPGHFFRDYQISENGEHYAYNVDVQRTDIDATTTSKIVVDGKEIVQGTDLLLYKITNTGDIYYTCLKCGQNTAGFFRNNEKLVDKPYGTYWGGPDNIQQIPCLFRRDADVQQLTQALTTTTDREITACSPNGKYIVRDKPEILWPEGTKDVLFMNGTKIDEGGIENWVVNDTGKLTCVKRSSPLPRIDSLTINGRGNYIISDPGYPARILYSPSLKNIAVVQNEKWWVNGRATSVGQYEDVFLGDAAFYVYRF